MNTASLSERNDFVPITSTEVLKPKGLPFSYKWMSKGFYALYEGEQVNNEGSSKRSSWGFEVDYINDATKDGSLGYTLYMSRDGESFGNWFDQPTLFVRYYNIAHPLGNEKVNIPGLGQVSCFKTQRGPQGYSAVKKILWYDEKTSLLVKMEAHTLDGAKVYSCLLSEFSPLLSQVHTSMGSSGRRSSVAAQQVISEQNYSRPSKSVPTNDPVKKCPRCERKVKVSYFESHYEHCKGLKRFAFRVKLAMAIVAIVLGGLLYLWYSKNTNSDQANVSTNQNSVTLSPKQPDLRMAEVIRERASLLPNLSNENTQENKPFRELKYGEKLLLLSPNFVGKGWYHVRHQATGLEGWIDGNNIRLENSQLKTEPTVSTTPLRDSDLNAGKSIKVVVTPLRDKKSDVIYGAEARDEAGTLLAKGEQTAMEDNLLVVDETQYSSNGVVAYRGRLFFNQGNELVKEEKIWGNKRWRIFDHWISDRP
jgi:hypothetical protein